jgi:hypothetical protein
VPRRLEANPSRREKSNVRLSMEKDYLILKRFGFAPVNRPCGRLDGYGGWWFWRHRHQQLGSYLGRTRGEPAWTCRPAEEAGRALLLAPKL